MRYLDPVRFLLVSDHHSGGGCAVRHRRVLGLILLIHSVLLAYSANVHSPTLNEPAHLVAGLSHLKFGQFELYRVNPPLVRTVAALPVALVGYEYDWGGYYTGAGARPVFEMGKYFAESNEEQIVCLTALARVACIPFSILGALICCAWSRDLYGPRAGLAAATLWCFSPNILAHASLITPDAHGTAVGLAAVYTYWKWLNQPQWRNGLIAGLVLGAAQLSKTTMIVLFPLYPAVWLFLRLKGTAVDRTRGLLHESLMLFALLASGLYVLNAGYGFEGSCEPLGSFPFVSDLLTESASPASSEQGRSINRFRGKALAAIPLPLPRHYLLGIDVQQRDFEAFGRPSYLRGRFQVTGWWYYYVYAMLVKIPLGTWFLVVMSICAGRWRLSGWTIERQQLVMVMVPLTVLWVASSKSGFSHHMRYVLPCFPYIFIWVSGLFRPAEMQGRSCHLSNAGSATRAWCGCIGTVGLWVRRNAATVCLLSSVISSLAAYPHCLSFFSSAVGGAQYGHRHLLHSNIDWGQDLLFLRDWLERNAAATRDETVHVAYYGAIKPTAVGITSICPVRQCGRREDLSSTSRRDQWCAVSPEGSLRPGLYAISVNLWQGCRWKARDGQVPPHYLDPSTVELFREEVPVGSAGYSIRIFQIDHMDDAVDSHDVVARESGHHCVRAALSGR